MKLVVFLLILIGANSTVLSRLKLRYDYTLMKVTAFERSISYSLIINDIALDSVRSENIASDKEPSPDDFVLTEKDPEPNYPELKKNLLYPDSALTLGIEGKVILRVLVGKDGKVKQGRALIESTSNVIFSQPSIDVIMRTSFTPAFQKGEPIEVWLTLPIHFQLRNGNKVNDISKAEVIKKEEDTKDNDSIPFEQDPEPNYSMLKKNTVFPEKARREGTEGKVIVRVLVGKDGMPKPDKWVIEVSTNEIFNQAAVNAVMKTPFKPAIKKGQPIEVWVTVPMNFQLRNR